MTALLTFLKEPGVSWARKGRTGEGGRLAWTIDASGLSVRNRMLHAELIPATSEVSLQTRVRIKSSLVASSNGFEGFAIRHRGFRITGDGDEYEQVWDSNPQGRRNWVSTQHADWTTKNFLVAIPSNLGIDYVTWEVIVRAQSGQLVLSTVECRHAFVRPLNGVSRQTLSEYSSSALSYQQMSNETSTSLDDEFRHVRYIGNEDVSVSQGQMVSLNLVGVAIGGSYAGFSGGTPKPRVKGSFSIIAKLTKVGGGALHYFIDEGEAIIDKFTLLGGTKTFRAPSDFNRIEYLAGMQNLDDPSPSDPRMKLTGLLIEGQVSDFIAPSQ